LCQVGLRPPTLVLTMGAQCSSLDLEPVCSRETLQQEAFQISTQKKLLMCVSDLSGEKTVDDSSLLQPSVFFPRSNGSAIGAACGTSRRSALDEAVDEVASFKRLLRDSYGTPGEVFDQMAGGKAEIGRSTFLLRVARIGFTGDAARLFSLLSGANGICTREVFKRRLSMRRFSESRAMGKRKPDSYNAEVLASKASKINPWITTGLFKAAPLQDEGSIEDKLLFPSAAAAISAVKWRPAMSPIMSGRCEPRVAG